MNKTTLEQWRMFQAVVEHGGFAQAAEAVHKSQSTINHAVHKLQNRLGLELLEIRGRKAHLTAAGELMLRRADVLLQQAAQLEDVAESLAAGTEAEIRAAVDEVYPPDFLASALQAFSRSFPNTRVQLLETVLSGGAEQLQEGEVDLLVANGIPVGYAGEPIMRAEFIAVAHPGHPLHALGRELSLRDLQQHRQIVLRDSARGEKTDSGWLGAEQRWTVSHVATSVDMITRGMGFAWLPRSRVQAGIAAGRLAELPLGASSRRFTELYLVYADRDAAGPAARQLGTLLTRACENYPDISG
ncbi:MAG: LysR family transcriptional regulator [Halioglobus sp.]